MICGLGDRHYGYMTYLTSFPEAEPVVVVLANSNRAGLTLFPESIDYLGIQAISDPRNEFVFAGQEKKGGFQEPFLTSLRCKS